MQSMFQQSFALGVQAPQTKAVKLMDHSKDTEESADQMQSRLKNMRRLGITDLESKYLGSNDSLNFSRDVELADKIEIIAQR